MNLIQILATDDVNELRQLALSLQANLQVQLEQTEQKNHQLIHATEQLNQKKH